MKILQLTDLHVFCEPGTTLHSIPTRESLQDVVQRVGTNLDGIQPTCRYVLREPLQGPVHPLEAFELLGRGLLLHGQLCCLLMDVFEKLADDAYEQHEHQVESHRRCRIDDPVPAGEGDQGEEAGG